MLSGSAPNPRDTRRTRPADRVLNIITGWTYNRLCRDLHNRFCGGPGGAMRRGYPTDTDKRWKTINSGGNQTPLHRFTYTDNLMR